MIVCCSILLSKRQTLQKWRRKQRYPTELRSADQLSTGPTDSTVQTGFDYRNQANLYKAAQTSRKAQHESCNPFKLDTNIVL